MNIKKTFSRFFPECIYGGMDGIITTFAIVAGVAGAGVSASVIVVLGVASVVADAFSMATSNYVSQRSACSIDKKKCSPYLPVKTSLATFVSFLIAGSIPLFPYIFAVNSVHFSEYAFTYSVAAAFILFFIIGYAEGVVSKKRFWPSLGLGFKTLLIGIVAALIAYGIGFYLSTIVTIA